MPPQLTQRPPQVGDLITDQQTGRPRVVQSVDLQAQTLVLEPEDPTVAAGFEGVDFPLPSILTPGQAVDAVAKEDPSLLQTLASGFDPRTPEGRRNLAGTTAAIAASAGATQLAGAVAGSVVPGVGTAAGTLVAGGVNVARGVKLAVTAARVLGPPLAAAAAGGTTAAVEAVLGPSEASIRPESPPEFGGPPRLPQEVEEPPLFGHGPAAAFMRGALEQGAYEVGGQVLALPIKFLVNRAITRPFVALQATRGVKAIRKEVQETFKVTIQAARSEIDRVSDLVRVANRDAKRLLGLQTRQAGRAAREGAGAPPRFLGTGTPTTTGVAVAGVLRGPARTVRQELGEKIAQVAEAGPDLPTAKLKEQAQLIFDTQIKDVVEGFGGAPPSSEVVEVMQTLMSRGATEAEQATLAARLVEAGVATDVAQATIQTASHPTMGLLRRFFNAPKTVPFRAAHQIKRELAEKSGDFTQIATQQSVQLTRAFRSSLDNLLDSSYAPYRAANEAFARVASIMKAPAAKQLLKFATTHPEVLVRGLRPGNVMEARMWRDLLLEVAPQAGPPGAQTGQVTWDLLRSTWAKEHLLQKEGIDELTKRLDVLPADFAEVLYGDVPGRSYLTGLRRIASSYDDAVAVAASTEESTIIAGRLAKRAASEGFRGARSQATEAGKRLIELESEFATSTILGKRSMEFVLADLAKSMFLGVTNVWGAVSTVRLLRGPKGADLVRWGALSSRNTQLLVEAMTGSAPGRAMAVILRDPDIGAYLQDPLEHELRTFLEDREAEGPPMPQTLLDRGATTGGPPPTLSRPDAAGPPAAGALASTV